LQNLLRGSLIKSTYTSLYYKRSMDVWLSSARARKKKTGSSAYRYVTDSSSN